MRLRYLAFLLPLALLAQDAAQKDTKKEEKKDETPAAATPSPAVEKALSGFIDVGYRWVGIGGNQEVYRNIVNTFSGLRIPGLQLDYQSGKSKFVDEIHANASNLGDPYSATSFMIGKRGVYEYTGRFSDIYYYNFTPTFANPGLALGVLSPISASAVDMRNYDNELRIMPGRRITPYIGYTRNSSEGDGIIPFVANANEYPVVNQIRWFQENIYGGVSFQFNKWHVTAEEGATRFRDDQYLYSTQSSTGTRPNPIFGQTLTLNQALDAYGVRGSGPYTKVLATANPWSWLEFTGMFLYSEPATSTNYTRSAVGNFYYPNSISFFPTNRDQVYGNATQPHSSGYVAGEVTWKNLRVRQTWETDRFHTSGSGTLTSTFSSPTSSVTDVLNSYTWFVNNTTRAETMAFYDVSKNLTFRGGYRYEQGNSIMPSGLTSVTRPEESGEMRRNVGLVGVTARAFENKLTASADFEHADAKQVYYRTSPANYTLFRMKIGYQALKELKVGVNYNYYRNVNKTSGYFGDSQQVSAYAQYMPAKWSWISVIGDYSYSSIYSDITYRVPAAGTSLESLYQDNANTGTLLVDVKPKGAHMPQVSFGGSFVSTTGTRPTKYYQPLGRLLVPVRKHIELFGEWRYYGYAESLYAFEGFRSQQIMSGLRFLW
jgi:hypothetical protein